MFTNITDSETGNNKGGSGQLVHYLDKENRLFPEIEKQQWFNGKKDVIEPYDVRSAIDGNIARLGRSDSKFFLVNLSPSQKEIDFLIDEYGLEEAKECLKDFAVAMMDEYAKNFKRPGIESNEDLLWFGKLEHYRYFSFRDAEVKSGEVKAGSLKPGSNWHVQVIVSRKDITNSIKLSPMNKSRGKNALHSAKLGQFDRSALKKSGEQVFDKMFGFERWLKETFEYANLQNKGSLVQKMDLAQKENEYRDERNELENELRVDNLLEGLLKVDYHEELGEMFRRKKRRNLENGQDQGLSL